MRRLPKRMKKIPVVPVLDDTEMNILDKLIENWFWRTYDRDLGGKRAVKWFVRKESKAKALERVLKVIHEILHRWWKHPGEEVYLSTRAMAIIAGQNWATSFIQETKGWIDQNLWCKIGAPVYGLDPHGERKNFNDNIKRVSTYGPNPRLYYWLYKIKGEEPFKLEDIHSMDQLHEVLFAYEKEQKMKKNREGNVYDQFQA